MLNQSLRSQSKEEYRDVTHKLSLTVDLPEYNLWRGQVGTVVEMLAGLLMNEVE